MTVFVTHSKVTGKPSNPSALIDGPAWDATHVISGSVDLTITQSATGNHYAPTAVVNRINDRVFIGAATLNNGTNVSSQPDWLTTYQLSTGRTFGFIQVAQSAILNDSNATSANTLVVGAETDNLVAPGNAIGIISVGKNGHASSTVNTYAYYGEGYRSATSAGGAYAMELDTVNFNSTVTIDPFQQASGQTIGLQLAAGAALSPTGQSPASAAINIQGNNSTFRQAINIASNALDTTGNANPDALAMANPWSITWYNAASAKTWQIFVGSGANGNLNFSTPGTGAIVFGGSGPFGQSFNVNGTGGAGYYQLLNQSSAPSTPTTAVRLYADNSNRVGWVGTNGFAATLDATANSASRAYTLPNVSGPITVGGGLLNFVASAVNFNSANTDTQVPITLPPGSTRYLVATVYITGASASISTATVGLFTASGGGGVSIVPNSAITVTSSSDATANNAMVFTPATANTQSYLIANEANLFIRVGTAQGSAATANVVIQIRPMP